MLMKITYDQIISYATQRPIDDVSADDYAYHLYETIECFVNDCPDEIVNAFRALTLYVDQSRGVVFFDSSRIDEINAFADGVCVAHSLNETGDDLDDYINSASYIIDAIYDLYEFPRP